MNMASSLMAVAQRFPRGPAVSHGAETLDYESLARRARAIGGSLRASGLEPGDRVVLCMQNCRAFFEMLYGIWCAGLCAVPANAKLHPLEIQHIVSNAGARLCVTTGALAAGLEGVMPGETRLVVSDDATYREWIQAEPAPVAERGPEDAAWIFYTSGTTGRPKGAILSHRALLFMCQCYYADVDFVDGRDTVLHAAPLSHAAGLYALPHLARGGHQVILSGGFDPEQVFSALEAFDRVSFFAAPTMVTRLVRAAGSRPVRADHLKTLIYGGGAMYVEDLKQCMATFGPKLFQVYGQGESPMTITGLGKTHHADSAHARYEELLASSGYARTGVEVRVVDAEDRDLPFGEVGEIITRSDCMMQGYWGNPDATRDTLRGGWLHTGDLGTLDADGFLTLRDRSKDLIISGGTNIYPREIEEALLRHEAVIEVSVVGQPHPEWGEQVVAFVVREPGSEAAAQDLDAFCLGHMARFKRPRRYCFVDTLPKNNYGKVLKTELRKRLASDLEEAP